MEISDIVNRIAPKVSFLRRNIGLTSEFTCLNSMVEMDFTVLLVSYTGCETEGD